jgi:acetylglutamate synthase
MSENTPKPSATFDSEALVAVQRRNVEAFTSAGKIVAAGMRTYADRQASMMREGLHTLWSELQTDGRALMTGEPSGQHARVRAAFDQVLGQVQELSQGLLKAQSEAMAVLNDCAAANMKALGGMTPDLAAMQRAATEAMQAASHQVAATIEETRKRLTMVQAEAGQALDSVGQSPPASANTPAAAKKARTKH